jgi:hypothetical protein
MLPRRSGCPTLLSVAAIAREGGSPLCGPRVSNECD